SRTSAYSVKAAKLRLSVELLDWPDFDTPQSRGRDFRRHLDCVVQIARIDQVKATQLLLRLSEGTVGSRHLAVADPYGRGRLNPLKPFTTDVVAALPDPFGEGIVFPHERV